jgi:uncharacterized membrane protein
MNTYLLLKLTHIFCAIIAVGANMSYALWLTVGKMNPQHQLFALKGIKRLDDWVANPAYILALITGHIMLFVADIPMTTPWVLAGEILFVAQGLIAFPLYTPTLRKQIAAGESLGLDSEEFRRLDRKGTILGITLNILAVLIVVVMVLKPQF